MAETRAPRARMAMLTEVRRSERIGDSMVRVVLGGGELERFNASEFTDSYVKLVFLSPGVEYPRALDINALRETHAPEHQPRLRTYTVRDWDAERQELTLDVVVHGDSGLAGPWARAAKPGDEVYIVGPGGEYAPDLSADWHLMVGDESAMPAICVAVAALPADAIGHVYLEVEGPQDEVELTGPEGVSITWLHRAGGHVGDPIVEAVGKLDFPAGRVQAFVHGEAGFVKELRRLLRIDHGLAREQLSISGYWRYGADDEGWRAIKREWNSAVEAEEQAAGVA